MASYYHQDGETQFNDLSDGYPESDMYYEDDEAYLQELAQKEYERMASEFSVFNNCVLPSLTQGIESVWVLLVLCLAIRCLSLLKVNTKLLHVASAVAGAIALWHFYEQLAGYVILLVVIGYISMTNSYSGKGAFLSAISVAYMLSCEKIFVKEMAWNKIRGSVMVVAMKLISIGFDRQNDVALERLDTFSYYGYILNPASVIFGPFVTYRDYLQLCHSNSLNFSWLGNVLRTFVLSAACLLWSTCGTTYVIPKIGSNVWIDAFKDANSFRFSTYFVSYTSEATCILSGIGTVFAANEQVDKVPLEKDNDVIEASNEDQTLKDSLGRIDEAETFRSKEKQPEITLHWSRPVSVPLSVEVPRSLVEVVTNWNLPMHYWLKTYVFKTSRHLGTFPAIFITYFASSLLHGLNFQLSVILLSIGVFAYVEDGVRKTLSAAFDACIEARSCKKKCSHLYKKNNFWVICTNAAFGFISVFNLAYLGCLFDNDPEIQEKGYSMSHALRKWADLGYVCHYFMFGVFLVNKLIRDGLLFSRPGWARSERRGQHKHSTE